MQRVLEALRRETLTNHTLKASASQIADQSTQAAHAIRKNHPKVHLNADTDEEEDQMSTAYQQSLLDRAVCANAHGAASDLSETLGKDADGSFGNSQHPTPKKR